MAINLGELYAVLSLRNTGWAKSAREAGRTLEDLSSKVKHFGREAGQVATALAAVGAGAVALAAQYDRGTALAVQGLKDSTVALSVAVAKPLTASLKQASSALNYLTAVVQGMAPATREAIGNFYVMATAVASVVAIGSKIASPFLGLLGALIPLIPVVAGLALVLGAVMVVTGLMRTAWDKNWGGIREKAQAVVNWLGEAWATFVNFWRTSSSGAADSVIKSMAGMSRMMVGMLKPVADALGGPAKSFMDAALAGLAYFEKNGLGGLVAGAEVAWKVVKDFGGEAWSAISEGAQANIQDILKAIGPIGEKLRAALKAAGINLDVKAGAAPHRQTIDQLNEYRSKAWAEFEKSVGGVSDAWRDMSTSVEGRIAQAAMGSMDAISKRWNITNHVGSEAAQRVMKAVQGLAGKFLSRLGTAGELMETAMQGFQAGGPWGAIIAVAIDLLSRSETFKSMIDLVNEGLQMIADGLGKILTPFVAVFRGINSVIGGLMAFLGPMLEALFKPLENLAPFLQVIGILLEALAPLNEVFKMLSDLLGGPLKEALKVFFDVVKMVAWFIIEVAKFFVGIWNGILGAIASVMKELAKFDLFGSKPFAFLGQWANTLLGAQVSTQGMTDAQTKLMNTTWDTAMAMGKASTAAQAAAAALSNVPSGYRVALARFNATTPELPHLAGGGIVRKPTMAVLGESGPEAVVPLGRGGGVGGTVIANFFGITDPEAIWRELKRLMERDNFRARGSPYATAPPMLTR